MQLARSLQGNKGSCRNCQIIRRQKAMIQHFMLISPWPPSDNGKFKLYIHTQCFPDQKNWVSHFCVSSTNKVDGSRAKTLCHRIEVTRVFITNALPRQNSWQSQRFYFNKISSVRSGKPSQLCFRNQQDQGKSPEILYHLSTR